MTIVASLHPLRGEHSFLAMSENYKQWLGTSPIATYVKIRAVKNQYDNALLGQKYGWKESMYHRGIGKTRAIYDSTLIGSGV